MKNYSSNYGTSENQLSIPAAIDIRRLTTTNPENTVLYSMSLIVKTATIPHLNSSRYLSKSGAASTDLLNASEEELAAMSEATLDRLTNRVSQIANGSESQEASIDSNESEVNPATEAIAENATRSVVEQILERSNASIPVVFLFVGTESNHHVDEMSARVAAALSEHTQSRVLLIDSDTVSRNLTATVGQQDRAGMTEVIEYNQDWRSNLLRNKEANVDFLPIGNGNFGRWNQQELLQKAVCEMKAEYQFVCVSGGDAHSKASKLWSDVCDGSYLLVSIKSSNGTVAKSAVTELKANGARLLGCVVTDVDNP